MILHSSQILPRHISLIGGKARGLLWLKSQGLTVPDFYVIDSNSIKKYLDGEISPDEVSAAITMLSSSEKYAVRSSAIEEDGADHSFAGVHLSLLNVCGHKEIRTAIFQVIASARSEIAVSYRRKKGLSTNEFGMAIVIQKMVDAQFAGVSFGIDLRTGSRKAAWISCVPGLGESLVSGESAGNEYLYDGEIQTLRSDSDADLQKLKWIGAQTLALSTLKAHPQDIEWAYDQNQIYFLQIRPVTAGVTETSLPKTVFDNSNIQESYCGTTTPLTFTYAAKAYEKVYEQLMRYMFIPEKTIRAASWNLRNMLGFFEGQVYYNINNWYAGLLFFPSFDKRKEDMENMMGLEKPVDFVRSRRLSLKDTMKSILPMAKLMTVMIYRFARMAKLVEEYDRWFWRLYNEVNLSALHSFSEFEIFEKIRVYQDLLVEKWGIPVLNDTKVMMEMGAVKRKLKKYGVDHDLKSIMYGAEIESLQPTIEIHRLSQAFTRDAALAELLYAQKGDELLYSLQVFYPETHQQVDNYIRLYGDRCVGELKFETITMRQDCEVLFSLIRQFVSGGLHKKLNVFTLHTNEQVFTDVLKKMNFVDRFFFGRKVTALKKSVAAREKMRLHRTRNFGMMRALYLALGERWQNRDLITLNRDVLFLTHEEILQIGSGQIPTRDLKALVELRRRDFENSKSKRLPPQMQLAFPPTFQKIETRENHYDGSILNGLPCSRGFTEGQVVVVREASEALDLQDKILVAERTDPGWTPLFTLVRGVIIERGSMLSHSAVIAREMGIPAVVAIENVTQILKTGDYVRLDGNNGTIEIIRPGGEKFLPAQQI